MFSLIPNTDWAGLVKIPIVIVIGYCGGVAVPLGLFMFGVITLIAWITERNLK